MRFAHPGLLAGILACLGSAASAANFADGSFEDPVLPQGTQQLVSAGGSIGPWQVTGNGSVALVGADNSLGGFTLQAKNGTQFVNLAGNGNSHSGIEQIFKTIPGRSYFLWFRIGTLADTSHALGPKSRLLVTLDGQPQGIFHVESRRQLSTKVIWGRAGIFFTAAGEETTIDFIDGDRSGDAFCGLDEVTLRVAR